MVFERVVERVLTRAAVEERERTGGNACATGEQVGVRRQRQRQRLAATRLSRSRAVLGSQRERQQDNRPAEGWYVSACDARLRDDYRPECPGRPSPGRTPTPAPPAGIAWSLIIPPSASNGPGETAPRWRPPVSRRRW